MKGLSSYQDIYTTYTVPIYTPHILCHKAKKTQFEETEKVSESDMTGILESADRELKQL